MIFTKRDDSCFNAATECHICGDELAKDRARDHCHLIGKFRGAAHESCKVNYQIPKFFPAIFHTISGYDSHLFIKTLKAKCEDKDKNIKCTTKNEEDCIHYIQQSVLVDSFMKEVIDEHKAGKEVGRHEKSRG